MAEREIQKFDLSFLELEKVPNYTAKLIDLQNRKKSGNFSNDAFKPLCYLAKEYGYQCEKHTVTTDDGYILSVWRVPGKIGENTADHPPVIMQHGLGVDMFNYWINEP